MIILIYAFIVLSSVTQSVTTKLFNQKLSCSAVFNAIKSLTSLVLFALISLFGFTFHLETMFFGVAYGACLCVSMYTGYQALCRGPMALTSMLVAFSVIIPLIWGITAGNEVLKTIQYPGIVLLFIVIALINADKIKAKKTQQTKYGLWFMFVGITFVCNGVCSILQKQHQTLYLKLYNTEFMLFSALLCSLVFFIVALKKFSIKDIKTVRGKSYGVLSGLANGTANYLTLILAGMENASVLFPIISAGTILACVFCGRVLFKEKLKANHYVALVLGIVAVVLLKL